VQIIQVVCVGSWYSLHEGFQRLEGYERPMLCLLLLKNNSTWSGSNKRSLSLKTKFELCANY